MAKESVTNTVKERRTDQGLTQQQLADEVGVSRQTVVAIEGGNYTPSVLLALRISEALNQSVEEIFSIK